MAVCDYLTVSAREDTFSGLFSKYTVRIGSLLGRFYGISFCTCNIGNAFCLKE
jgi:hypothetical protein